MAAKTHLTNALAWQNGKAARDVGMELAARRKEWLIRRDTLRFLDAMMSNNNRTASTDDAADDLSGTFADGGKWRGSIPKNLARTGLIVKAGVAISDRPARHRGYVALWRAVDLLGVERKRKALRRWLAEHPCPAEPVAESLFDNVEGERTVANVG